MVFFYLNERHERLRPPLDEEAFLVVHPLFPATTPLCRVSDSSAVETYQTIATLFLVVSNLPKLEQVLGLKRMSRLATMVGNLTVEE